MTTYSNEVTLSDVRFARFVFANLDRDYTEDLPPMRVRLSKDEARRLVKGTPHQLMGRWDDGDDLTIIPLVNLRDERAAPPVEAKPAEGVREAIQATIRDKVSGPSFTDPAMKLAHEQDIAIAADAILALLPARDEAAQQFAENAHCSAALPEGWVAAPRHPTHSMKTAGARVCGNYDLAHDAWVQMLAAAPQAHPATGTDELPADVVRLVQSVRDAEQHFEPMSHAGDRALTEMQSAVASFASRVPLNEGEGR